MKRSAPMLAPLKNTLPTVARITGMLVVGCLALSACDSGDDEKPVVLPPVADTGWSKDAGAEVQQDATAETETVDPDAVSETGPDGVNDGNDGDGGCEPATCASLGVECGQHDDGCGGTLSCNSLCTPIDNSSATCLADFSCSFICDSGHHTCDDSDGVAFCADDEAPETCGTSCTPCAVPDNGVATCGNDGTCGIACEPGFDICNDNVCVDRDTDPNHCGVCNKECAAGCLDGECIPEYDIAVTVGDNQTGTIGDTVAVPIQITVTDAGTPVSEVEIEFIAPAGAAIDPAVGQTNPAGVAFASARLGRAPGTYEFTARLVVAPDIEVKFQATAEEPADGVLFSLVNWEHVGGNTPAPGPGTTTRIGEPRGVTVASDGTIYFTDWVNSAHKVRALSPDGELTDIAGITGSGGFAGDYGDALAAKLNQPSGIALDEATQVLYVADSNNDRVRAIDLTNGTISTIAGGGSPPGPGYGDGSLAADPPSGGAFIDGPTHLSIGPDNLLYVTDSKHDRIRRVDPVANTIDAFVSATTTNKCEGQVVLTDCGSGCAMTWSDDGAMFLSGKFACGETEAKVNQAVPGIVRVELDGTMHHVAGKLNGSGGNNIPAQSAALGVIEGLAFDPVGNLFITEGDTVRVIDAAIGRLTTVAGQATAGSLGDFGPGLDAELSSPYEIATWGRHVIIADSESFSIRTLWNVGALIASAATLTTENGDGQSAFVSQQFAQPLSVKITDGDDSTLPGVPVTFAALTEGGGTTAPRSPAAANGVASVAARPGLSPGTYSFEASFRDIHGYHVTGSPVTFTTTAGSPFVGTLFSVVNADGVVGDEAVPAPATLTRGGNIADVAVASDGTIYFSQWANDSHRVRAVSPSGELTNIAGVGTDGFSGNNGPAVLAEFDEPYGLALNEALQVLYVADRNNHVVRAIELTGEKRITVYAGGGTADGTTNFGDGDLAINGTLDQPTHLALNSAGDLFITDSEHDRIRRVDGTTGFITTELYRPPNNTSCNDMPVLGSTLNGGALSVDASDNLWVYGNWSCLGAATSTNSGSPAIVSIATNGTRTHWVGEPTGSPADAVSGGLNAKLSLGNGLAVDTTGNVYFADGDERVRRWNATTDSVMTLTGQFNETTGEGIPGFAGDYSPAADGYTSDPRGLALHPMGHLLFADFDNAAVRAIWQLVQ